MDLYLLLEKNIVRWIGLVERFYYRPERSVHNLAHDLHADRNTILNDVEALLRLLKPYIAGYTRAHGTVRISFLPGISLLSLEQLVYQQSNFLSLACAYLVDKVDIARFAHQRGMSISSAYALNQKVLQLFRSGGADIKHGQIVGDELTRRLLGILIWSTIGYQSRTMRKYRDTIQANIEALCAELGQTLTDLDYSFVQTALGIALDRKDKPLPAWFVNALHDIPLAPKIGAALNVKRNEFPLQEQLFVALTIACVTAKNPPLPNHSKMRTWIETDAIYRALQQAMISEYGNDICSDELFVAALQRLYLYTRFGVSNTALMQHREIPAAFRSMTERNSFLVSEWATANNIEMYHPNPPMVDLFTLQILPLVRGVYTPQPFVCAIVTRSELNCLTFSRALLKAFPSLAHIVPQSVSTIEAAQDAIEAYRAQHDNIVVAPAYIVVDVEYPTAHNTDSVKFPLVTTSLSEACDKLPLAIHSILPRRLALDTQFGLTPGQPASAQR